MDALDFEILGQMGWRAFEQGARGPDSLRAPTIARALGMSVDAIKERIARLESSGIIRGYEIYPNLRLLGLQATTFHYRIPNAQKETIIRNLEPLEGVSTIFDFVSDEICVDLHHRGPADVERKLRLIGTLTGTESPYRLYDMPLPKAGRPLTQLDWRILRAMRGNARRPLGQLAEAVGVSQRTIKRRLQRLIQESAFDTIPLLDPSRMPGFIPVGLAIFLSSPNKQSTLQAIHKAVGERFLYGWQPPSPELAHYELAAYADNMGQVAQIRAQVEAVSGVAKVDLLMPTGVVANDAWLNEAMDTAIAGSAAVSQTLVAAR